MKIRLGFVSNSSSSSFICDVSGSIESGYDMGIDEAGMYECEKGHTFLTEFLVDDGSFDEYSDSDEYDPYCIPEKYCPICTLTKIKKETKLQYILNKFGLKEDEIENEISSRFKSLTELEEYFNSSK